MMIKIATHCDGYISFCNLFQIKYGILRHQMGVFVHKKSYPIEHSTMLASGKIFSSRLICFHLKGNITHIIQSPLRTGLNFIFFSFFFFLVRKCYVPFFSFLPLLSWHLALWVCLAHFVFTRTIHLARILLAEGRKQAQTFLGIALSAYLRVQSIVYNRTLFLWLDFLEILSVWLMCY